MNLGGIAGADAICTAEAGQAAKAFLVDDAGCGGAPCRRASVKPWPPTEGRVDWPLLPRTTYYNKDWTKEVGQGHGGTWTQLDMVCISPQTFFKG